MISSIRVGDRVIAKTSEWGEIEGIVVAIALGRYARIQRIADNRIYGVLLENCRRVSKKR